MKKNKSLLEWYNSNSEEGDSGSETIVVKSIEEPPISQCDLGDQPMDSPQGEIQKEIIKKEIKQQLTTQNDQVIVQDKVRIYKSMGIIEVIKGKLTLLSSLTSPYADEAMKKEDLSRDIKKLAAELTEIVGSL